MLHDYLLLVTALEEPDPIYDAIACLQKTSYINAYARDEDGNTQLHRLFNDKDIEHVKLVSINLLFAFFNKMGFINIKNKHGDTSLHLALKAKEVQYDLVKCLVAQGEDVSIRDAAHYAAIDYASKQGHKEIVELSINQLSKHACTEISCNACLSVLESALACAISGGHSAIIELLVDNDIVNLHTNNKMLFYAFCALLELPPNSLPFFQSPFPESTAHLLLHKLLNSHYLYINQKDDSSGFTVLQLAIKYGHTAIVELLLKHLVQVSPGVINEKGPKGMTALHLASSNGHVDVVKWLLDTNWIDIQARDTDGYSALDLAKRAKHQQVVDLLRPYTPSSSCTIS
ncbi:MAG: ankyrin repeat domain-containing protein [Amoebophilaceae bacterium]|nr:ankyrin repeat domain-containing protein [Amoebophilaceae bacterium]